MSSNFLQLEKGITSSLLSTNASTNNCIYNCSWTNKVVMTKDLFYQVEGIIYHTYDKTYLDNYLTN